MSNVRSAKTILGSKIEVYIRFFIVLIVNILKWEHSTLNTIWRCKNILIQLLHKIGYEKVMIS